MRFHPLALPCFIVIVCVLLAPSASAQGPNFDTPEVKVEYDKFKDVTVVSIPPIFVIKPQPVGLQFGMMSGYKGIIATPPKGVLLIFFSMSEDAERRYSISHGVIVLADGERIRLGDATYNPTYNKGFYIEQMMVDVPFVTLQKISKAKSVEIQIGGTDFAVQEKLLETMRRYVKSFNP